MAKSRDRTARWGAGSTVPEGHEMVPPRFWAVDFALHVGYAKDNNVPAELAGIMTRGKSWNGPHPLLKRFA